MKKALASIVIIAFVGLLCTSILAIFSGQRLGKQYLSQQHLQYPYVMAY